MSSYESTASSTGFAQAASSSRIAAEYSDASETSSPKKLNKRCRCRSCHQHFENVNLLHAHLKDHPQCNLSPSKNPHARSGPAANEIAVPASPSAGRLAKGKQRADKVSEQDAVLLKAIGNIIEAQAQESTAMQRGSSGGTTDGTTDPEQAVPSTESRRAQKKKRKKAERKAARESEQRILPQLSAQSQKAPEQPPELPSPSPSIASSTDELPYVPPGSSSSFSPPMTPSLGIDAKDASIKAARIPFQQPITPFDILSSSFPNNPTPPSADIQAPAPSELPRPTLYSHKSTPSTSSVASTVKKVKKVPASPLVWGASGSSQAIDAPTLGTTQTDMQSHSPENDLTSVYRASHAVGKDTIVQELAKRMHAGLSLNSEPNEDRSTGIHHDNQSTSVNQTTTRISEQEEADDEAGDTTLKAGDEDGIVRKDMLKEEQRSNPSAPQERDNSAVMEGLLRALAAAPPERNLQSAKQNGYEVPDSSTLKQAGTLQESPAIQERPNIPRNQQKVIDSVGETSAIQGTLPVKVNQPTAFSTTDGEEDDGTRSEASASSDMIRGVVRDLDDRTWGEEAQVPDLDKARLRFGRAVIELDKRHRANSSTITKRQQMLLAVQRQLNGTFAGGHYHAPKYELRAFGSTAYGLDTDASDLDLCIIDFKRPDGFRNALDLYELEPEVVMTSTDEEVTRSPVKKGRKGRSRSPERNGGTQSLLDPVYDVKRLAGVLRRMGMREVTAIPTAGVPIVKFVDHAGIKADMNANEQLGVRNSALLAAYIKQSPLVRPFLIFLKLWAKQRGINDPSGQQGEMSLSSYSLVLLGLTYLQSINLIPNLQDIELIKQSGMQRQAFWSKVLDKKAARSRSYNMRGKIAGDYKAMAIETTFVANLPSSSGWRPTWPSAEYHEKQQKDQNAVATAPAAKTASPNARGGWEAAAPSFPTFDTPADKAETANLLFRLIEGFFTYYSSFPIETQAVSLWRGKPLQRQNTFDKAKTDTEEEVSAEEKGITDLSAEEREELYEEQAVDDDEEEVLPANMKASSEDANGHESSPAYTDEESSPAVEAAMAKLEAQLREAGITDLGPRFDEIKQELASKANVQSGTDSAEFETTEDEITDDTGNLTPRNTVFSREAEQPAAIAAAAAAAQAGLSIEDADPNDNYRFPFPVQENPEHFVEPAIWTQKLVVQDPFIHTRNVCLNIKPPMVDRIMGEMQRAATMLREGAPIDSICLSTRVERKRKGIPNDKGQKKERAKFENENRKAARAANNHFVKEWQDRDSLKNKRQEERDLSKRGRGGFPAENGRGRGGYPTGPHFNKFSHQNEGYQGGNPGRGRGQGSPYRGGRGKPPFQRNRSPERS